MHFEAVEPAQELTCYLRQAMSRAALPALPGGNLLPPLRQPQPRRRRQLLFGELMPSLTLPAVPPVPWLVEPVPVPCLYLNGMLLGSSCAW